MKNGVNGVNLTTGLLGFRAALVGNLRTIENEPRREKTGLQGF